MDPRQWYDLLWEALGRCCGTQLKYLLDFVQFGEFVHGYTPQNAKRATDGNTRYETTPTNFDFTGGTQCVLLATGPEKRWVRTDDPRVHYTGRFVERRHLLLTRNGKMVTWRWVAEERDWDGTLYEVAVSSSIILDGTIELARTYHKVAQEGFFTLSRLLKARLEKDEERLESKREVVNPIKDVAAQILLD